MSLLAIMEEGNAQVFVLRENMERLAAEGRVVRTLNISECQSLNSIASLASALKSLGYGHSRLPLLLDKPNV